MLAGQPLCWKQERGEKSHSCTRRERIKIFRAIFLARVILRLGRFLNILLSLTLKTSH